MHIYKFIRHKLTLILIIYLFSPLVFAQCSDTCMTEFNNCEQSATEQQKFECMDQFNICKLKCNRSKTHSCVWLAFKNHEGTADREQEIREITGGFARVTHEEHPHFAGLCSSNNMRCEYVLNWDRTMYSCGGQKREATRVACCR